MRRFRIGFILGALAVATAANGCFIGVEDFSRTCVNASTCPKIGGYICASSAKCASVDDRNRARSARRISSKAA